MYKLYHNILIFLFVAIFVAFQMAVTSLSIILTTITLRIHNTTSSTRPPVFVRMLVLGGLARILCLGKQLKPNKVHGCDTSNKRLHGSLTSLRKELSQQKGQISEDSTNVVTAPGDKHADGTYSGGPISEDNNSRLLQYIEVVANKIKEDAEAKEISDEWKKIAWVLDWFFFWMNVIVIILATFMIYAKPVLSQMGT